MATNVKVESPWLRPWINETPKDEACEDKPITKQWECMTYEERQEYLEERAKTVITK